MGKVIIIEQEIEIIVTIDKRVIIIELEFEEKV
jgi:hypothetical protein